MSRSLSFIMRPSDWRTLVLLGALSLCYAAILGWKMWWLIPVAGILCVSACAAKHNHTHCPTFGYRWMNRLMDFWLTALTGTSTSGIRIAHQVLHHGGNQSPEDLVRCSLVEDLPPGRALGKYVPMVVREVWKTKPPTLSKARSGMPSLNRDCLMERIVLWVAIAAMLVAFGPLALVGVGLAWIFGQWFLIAMNLPQHDGCDADSRWEHSRNVTGRLANWFFLNNGYHTAQHLWPGRHWGELPHLHGREVAAHLPPRLACDSLFGFWRTWWQDRAQRATGGVA